MASLLTARKRGAPGPLSFAASVAGHLLLFLFFLLLTSVLEPAPLQLGGSGGGPGDVIQVGLTAELGGGAGTYKPTLEPSPEAAPPVEEKRTPEEAAPPEIETPVFEEKATPEKEPKKEVDRPKRPPDAAPSRDRPREPSTGVIPRQPDPGAGGRPGAFGGGGGGEGPVRLGAGIGPGIDSWYLRQVERRLAENWLKTTLGRFEGRVQAVISFEILKDGRLENIRLESSSGIGTVDLSAERAVRASSPLPPLPLEFRHRKVRLVAQFEYPPR